MEVSIIFKIAAVGIVVSILNQILKHNGRDDQAALTALARASYCHILDITLYT